MTTDRSPKFLVLSMVLLGLAFLLVSSVALALFVPFVPCPYHQPEEPFAEPDPCMGCNGYGRATLFQHWNRVRYEQQREPFLIKL